MNISQGELIGWAAVSEVLFTEEPAEWELLPDIVESSTRDSKTIGKQPGAFDINIITLVAHTLYSVVYSGIQAGLPKLFDAALDVGKEELKRNLARRTDPPKVQQQISPRAIEIREAIANAALRHNLSARTAAALADNLIASLAEKSLL